jgi:hypothetical protein
MPVGLSLFPSTTVGPSVIKIEATTALRHLVKVKVTLK